MTDGFGPGRDDALEQLRRLLEGLEGKAAEEATEADAGGRLVEEMFGVLAFSCALYSAILPIAGPGGAAAVAGNAAAYCYVHLVCSPLYAEGMRDMDQMDEENEE